jgi:hypothetical protein
MRSFLSSLVRGGAFAVAALAVGQSASAAIVYQSTNPSGGVNVNGNAFDYLGDSAFLAGTERELTQIDLGTKRFGNVGTTNLGLTMEVYADMSVVDGLPDDVDAITPGNQYQILASSSITQAFIGSGDHTSVFTFANVLVPDNIVFVVKQDTFDNNFQVLFGTPAAIGDSFTVSGAERTVISSQGNDNFQRANAGSSEVVATIYAVPEPASLGVLALGALACFGRRRSA